MLKLEKKSQIFPTLSRDVWLALGESSEFGLLLLYEICFFLLKTRCFDNYKSFTDDVLFVYRLNIYEMFIYWSQVKIVRESKNEEDCAREMYKNTLKKLKKLKKSKLYRDKERESIRKTER